MWGLVKDILIFKERTKVGVWLSEGRKDFCESDGLVEGVKGSDLTNDERGDQLEERVWLPQRRRFSHKK